MIKKSPWLALLVLVSCISSTSLLRGDDFLDDAERPSPLKNDNIESPVNKLQNTFHEIYNLYKDSVVFISTEMTVEVRYRNPFMEDPFFREFFGGSRKSRKKKRKGLGTGFIISKDGYICTNNHVISYKTPDGLYMRQVDSVSVKINKKTYKATIVGADHLTDIALLKIQSNETFKPVYFGNSDNVKIGDMSIVIGNPFGLDRTYTFGIISATGRTGIDVLGNSYIQTDASINPGNSGGPLINIHGEVIGVNRMIYSKSGGNMGIGFAIPINRAKKVILELKKFGKVKRGYLGVQIVPMKLEHARSLGLSKPEGALVGSVLKGSPAYQAGIRTKDVIIAVNGKKIRNYRDLIKKINKLPIGSTAKITIWRDRGKNNLYVKITEKP